MGLFCLAQRIGCPNRSSQSLFHDVEKLGSGISVVIQIVDVSDHAWPDERKICLIAECINDALGDFSTGLPDARQSTKRAHALCRFGQSFTADPVIGDVNALSIRETPGGCHEIAIASDEHMIGTIFCARFRLCLPS